MGVEGFERAVGIEIIAGGNGYVMCAGRKSWQS